MWNWLLPSLPHPTWPATAVQSALKRMCFNPPIRPALCRNCINTLGKGCHYKRSIKLALVKWSERRGFSLLPFESLFFSSSLKHYLLHHPLQLQAVDLSREGPCLFFFVSFFFYFCGSHFPSHYILLPLLPYLRCAALGIFIQLFFFIYS